MILEQRQRVSKGHLGKVPWNKGKKMSKEFSKKISELTKNGICGMKGRRHTDATKEKQRLNNKTKLLWQNPEYRKMMSEKHKWQSGKNNPGYIDGRQPLVMRIRHSSKYKEWIKKVYERDDYTCKKCGRRGVKFEAHHIRKFSKIYSENRIKTFEQAMSCKELWNISNGETLCVKCHKKINTRR